MNIDGKLSAVNRGQSVDKAGTDDAKTNAKIVRDIPIDNAMISNAKI